jgi:hypothetical protein
MTNASDARPTMLLAIVSPTAPRFVPVAIVPDSLLVIWDRSVSPLVSTYQLGLRECWVKGGFGPGGSGPLIPAPCVGPALGCWVKKGGD